MHPLRIIGKICLIGIAAFTIHYLILKYTVSDATVKSFQLPIYQLYIIFIVLSSIIMLILERISKKRFDQTGMSFLVLTTVQLLLAYLIFRPIISEDSVTTKEKLHTAFIFVLFLTIQTLLTVRLLNKKA